MSANLRTPLMPEAPLFDELLVGLDESVLELISSFNDATKETVLEEIRVKQWDENQARLELKSRIITLMRKWGNYLVVYKHTDDVYELTERRFNSDGDVVNWNFGYWSRTGLPMVLAADGVTFVVDETTKQEFDDYAATAARLITALLSAGRITFGNLVGKAAELILPTDHLRDQKSLVRDANKGKLGTSALGRMDKNVAAYMEKRAEMLKQRKARRQWLTR